MPSCIKSWNVLNGKKFFWVIKNQASLIQFGTAGTGTIPVPIKKFLVMKNQTLKETFIENLK